MTDDLDGFRQEIKAQRTPLPRGNDDANLVVRGAELQWYTPAGTNPSRLAPVLGSPMRTFELFMQELPPGVASDMQQHHHEAVHCVLSGHGYSEIGDRTVEWGVGDFVCVPPMEWHRHYNGSDSEPVRMLLVENSRLLDALGLNYRTSAGFVTREEHRAASQPRNES